MAFYAFLVYNIQERNAMNCPNCKREVGAEFRFCPSCGTPILKEAPVNHIADRKIDMVNVAGGTFIMGRELPGRTVAVVDFSISKTPITQKQYETVVGINPSKLKGSNRPVECVNWCEALIFCNALSIHEGLHPCYSIGNNVVLSGFDASSPVWKRVECNFTSGGYRLPTEAEWEYAARGGISHAPAQYAGSDNINKVAWYGENSEITTHDVAMRAPNALGLYDMSGNVAEWCWDFMGDLPITGNALNPRGPEIGTMRVKRGGSWLDDPFQCTVFFRSGSAPTGKSSSLGFRVARSIPDRIL